MTTQNQQTPQAPQPQPMPQQPQQSPQPQPQQQSQHPTQPQAQPLPQQPQPLISFATTAPEPASKPNAWDSIIAQQQEQINALMAQNQALTGQITQMVQGGAQFTQQAPQQPQPQQGREKNPAGRPAPAAGVGGPAGAWPPSPPPQQSLPVPTARCS